MSEIIAEKLIDIESVKFSFANHFTLTSGLKSPVYVDCRKIISFIDERELIMNEAVNYFEKNKHIARNIWHIKSNFRTTLI